MKGTKEFNQRVFELFYLYNLRAQELQKKYVSAISSSRAKINSPEERLLENFERGKRALAAGYEPSSLFKAIRSKEKIFFHIYNPTGPCAEHPFVKFCRKLHLSRLEQRIVLCLLGIKLKILVFNDSPHIDRCCGFDTCSLINLIYPEPNFALARVSVLPEKSRLLKEGLCSNEHFGWKRKPISEFSLKPELANWLLGISDKEPDFITTQNESEEMEMEDRSLLEISLPSAGLKSVVLSPEQNSELAKALFFYQSSEYQKLFPKLKNQTNRQALLALFYGPPGTGKTITAQALAGELKKPLARVQIANVRNMWYGKSEKNLLECFTTARAKNLVLLFDEADSLISARHLGRGTSTDNVEHLLRNLFLQEIERFEGVVILTTNMVETLDPALERRLNLKLEFPLPQTRERERLWKKFLKNAPLAPDVNTLSLSQKFPLAGGHIKNAALNALRQLAFLRASEPSMPITQEMLEQAAKKEYSLLEFKNTAKTAGFIR